MFKKVDESAILPHAKTELSAGYDICSLDKMYMMSGETVVLPTGIALDLSDEDLLAYKDLYWDIHLRSGMGAKGWIIPHGCGIIDIDYRDPIGMILQNGTGKEQTIDAGQRIGQLVLMQHQGRRILGSKYRSFDRRVGGFGSTGEK